MPLIDTTVAVGLRDRTGGVRDRLDMLGQRPAISLLTWVELEGGVTGPARLIADRRAATDTMLELLRIVPCDAAVVRAYSRIVAAAGFSRRKVIDRLIAATAIVHDLTLITMNGDDFADIPGLSLEVWPPQ